MSKRRASAAGWFCYALLASSAQAQDHFGQMPIICLPPADQMAGMRVRCCPDRPRTHIRSWGRCIDGARSVFGGHPEECSVRFPC